ncbi:hypothetical protein BU24DRAFT_87264 [Aaosphaeria arxii CBS 175.79]|uniref:Uncharacterized protein n=1 Tax=Aaosphaeria arxii CBS 175.79 TaxID=1450172 RepID=A0A6A5X8V1_9PLEO|nr:uncharacterized protein BU24DRAFT_87264 [Aaosphaeria arxii CBS 175.79]KAF2009319.1 hypothetical protein BU24DRAFT_87264 [Aaosphaeria arxii CBS 175.79]
METLSYHHHNVAFPLPAHQELHVCAIHLGRSRRPGEAASGYTPHSYSHHLNHLTSKMITSAVHLPNGDILLDWIILLLALLVHFNLRNDRKPNSKVQHCRSQPSQTNIDSPLFHVQAVRYVPFLDGKPEFNIPVLDGPLDPETRIQVIDALQGALQEIERQNIRLSAVEKELKVLKERQAWRDEEAEWEDYDEAEGWEEGFEEDYEDYTDQSGDEYADDEDDLSIEDEEIKTGKRTCPYMGVIS